MFKSKKAKRWTIFCVILVVIIGSVIGGFYLSKAFLAPQNSSVVQEVQDLREEVKELRILVEEYESSTSDMHMRITVLNNKITELETQIATLQQDSESNKTKIAQLTQERDSLIAERNSLQAQYDEMQAALQTLTNKVAQLEETIANLGQTTIVGSNPNLLINGDFRINQRDFTQTVQSGYTVDRWMFWAGEGNTTAIVTRNESGSITIDNTNSDKTITFSQFMEDKDCLSLINKTLTLSAKINDNTYSCSGTLTKVDSNVWKTYFSVKFSDSSSLRFAHADCDRYQVDISVAAGDDVTVEWVKLEVGSIATAYSPRTYAEELALCQRYYQVLAQQNAQYVCTGFVSTSAAMYYIPLYLTVPMRAMPSLVSIPSWKGRLATGYSKYTSIEFVNVTSAKLQYLNNTCIVLVDNIGTAVDENNSIVSFECKNIMLDAEIY